MKRKWVIGKVGASCSDTCDGKGFMCVPDDWDVHDENSFRKAFREAETVGGPKPVLADYERRGNYSEPGSNAYWYSLTCPSVDTDDNSFCNTSTNDDFTDPRMKGLLAFPGTGIFCNAKERPAYARSRRLCKCSIPPIPQKRNKSTGWKVAFGVVCGLLAVAVLSIIMRILRDRSTLTPPTRPCADAKILQKKLVRVKQLVSGV
jgi:hypothetical protein